jgi:hypothetical protein
MSILDDAIREHLELKRAHGADESELKRLEDEAFGLPQRPEEPDPFAEAPTEFLQAPDAPEAEAAGDREEPGGRRLNVADLQEAPPSAPPAEGEPPEPAAAEEGEAPASPAAEEELPAEPEPAEQPIEGAGPNTEERHAIAEQPTQFFDVEAEIDADAPPVEAPSPSDEEIVDEELTEPRLDSVDAPPEPPAPGEAEGEEKPEEPPAAVPFDHEGDEEGDDDFWNDQRLSDELDQALEAPNTGEHAVPGFTDEHEIVEPPEDDEPLEDNEPPEDKTAASGHEKEAEEGTDEPDYDPDTGHEDVLEDTPEFLEDAPEDDDLWFEQRPPKDFDFDD